MITIAVPTLNMTAESFRWKGVMYWNEQDEITRGCQSLKLFMRIIRKRMTSCQDSSADEEYSFVFIKCYAYVIFCLQIDVIVRLL